MTKSLADAAQEMHEALKRLADEIAETEEHGDGTDEEFCSICEAHRAARDAIASFESALASDARSRNDKIEIIADAIDAARYQHPTEPRERPRPFSEADKGDREYATRLARAALSALASSPPAQSRDTDPHPRWKPGQSDRHPRYPQSIEEWNYRNDPISRALARSLKRLNVAGDYDDPRAPDQMALVLRTDLIRLKHDWIHKNAAFESHRQSRDEVIEECALIADYAATFADKSFDDNKEKIELADRLIAASNRSLKSSALPVKAEREIASEHLQELPDTEAELQRAYRFLAEKRMSARSDDLTGCTSYVQRQLQCGYNRAANLMEKMQERGWITAADTHGARRLLLPPLKPTGGE